MKTYGPFSRRLLLLISRALGFMETAMIRSCSDVGHGEGTNTAHLSAYLSHCQFHGIDFSSTAIEIAARINPGENLAFNMDLESEALNQPVDVVSSSEVLEHVEDWESRLERMANVAKYYLAISFPTERVQPFVIYVGHLRNFNKCEIDTILIATSIQPLSLKYTGFPFYSPLYREVCNLTDSARNKFTHGKYSLKQKNVANIMCVAFLCSTRWRWGDQFVAVLER